MPKARRGFTQPYTVRGRWHGVLVHRWTDSLFPLPEIPPDDECPVPDVTVTPHLVARLSRCSRGLHVRWSLDRTDEGKPPVHLGKMHLSPSLWGAVVEPGLRQMQALGRVKLTVTSSALASPPQSP
jgi:hypothetical protein